jgi:hypothetical protein
VSMVSGPAVLEQISELGTSIVRGTRIDFRGEDLRLLEPRRALPECDPSRICFRMPEEAARGKEIYRRAYP